MARVRTLGMRKRTRISLFFMFLSMLAIVILFSLFDSSSAIVSIKNFVKGAFSFFSSIFGK
ncbi:MAG: hypothetical protein NTZ83_02155 [Candidatus Pacearchaeota archaeon]|nr:hypothetical protein [Candidatus Pacearchaeota archaeon]